MSGLSEREMLDRLPKPVTTNEEMPTACSIGQYYPNILLRNDGFNANVAYTAEAFYAHLANILGNLVRMNVDGLVLQVSEDEQNRKLVNMMLLYDARRLITTGFTLDQEGITVVRQPGAAPDLLHQRPDEWSFEADLTVGARISFKPVYDIPLNYTIDAITSPEANGRNLESPAIVAAYGKGGVIRYAYENYQNPPQNKLQNTLSNEVIADGILLVTREVTGKIATLKGLK